MYLICCEIRIVDTIKATDNVNCTITNVFRNADPLEPLLSLPFKTLIGLNADKYKDQ